jgi:hypothetical protein
MQLRSIEEENGQGLDQIRPFRLVTVYGLVVGEASTMLAIEVDITGVCYQKCQVLEVQHCTCSDLLKKFIKRPEETLRNGQWDMGRFGLPTTQAENP